MLTGLRKRIAAWLDALRPVSARERRYRVTPRRNSFAFRRKLLRDIRSELRKAGLVSTRQPGSTSL